MPLGYPSRQDPEIRPDQIKSFKAGAGLSFSSDHPAYPHQAAVAPETRAALVSDLD